MREDAAKVVTIRDHLSRLKFSKALPLAFAEHGAIMAEPEKRKKPIGFSAKEHKGKYRK